MIFKKMHLLGNDFVIVDARGIPFFLLNEEIITIANRRIGVGCDQLLVIKDSNIADISVEIFNPDSSRAENCGNGLCCVAKIFMQERKVDSVSISVADRIFQASKSAAAGSVMPDGHISLARLAKPAEVAKHVGLSTTGKFEENRPVASRSNVVTGSAAGTSRCKYSHFCHQESQYGIRMNMGMPSFNCALDEATKRMFGTNAGYVAIGNPHVVVVGSSEVDDCYVATKGSEISSANLFPDGVNVEFMHITSDTSIIVKVFERGAGITYACGSGACASTIVAIRSKLVGGGFVRVSMPGGDLLVEYEQGGDVMLIGSPSFVYEGSLDFLLNPQNHSFR